MKSSVDPDQLASKPADLDPHWFSIAELDQHNFLKNYQVSAGQGLILEENITKTQTTLSQNCHMIMN